MIVIVLMGILAAIAIPSWFGLVSSRNATSAANQVAADLRLAHDKSTNRLAETYIVYRSDGNKVADCPVTGKSADYCLLTKSTSGSYEKQARSLPDGTAISGTTVQTMSSALATTLGLGSGAKTIKFKSDGSAEAPSGLVSGATIPKITVASTNGGSSYPVEVNTQTSRVKVG